MGKKKKEISNDLYGFVDDEIYRAIVEDQLNLISRHDMSGRILFANKAYCAFFGRDIYEIVGKGFIPPMPREDLELQSSMRKLISAGNPSVTYECRIETAAAVRWLQWNDRGIFDQDGRMVYLQSVAQDITDKIKTEHELKKSYDDLEMRVRERTAELSEMNAILTKEVTLREEADKELFEARAARERLIAEQKDLIWKLEEALEEVKALSGILPICSHCKKIRDDEGYWKQVEDYITSRSGAQFSHGVCPDCLKKFYPGLADRIIKDMDR